ncbi:MAG: efflux RND transporter periplasmic adaptor subunit [Ignavibacteria bacterium]|nr:efflux RND transporter periplasmic adaptor subunit [Ignavibacteria bacterium]MBI3766098.1 efflux RND transporter periplasmic adaptor subunit [Ignavibacteriales bacterium]
MPTEQIDLSKLQIRREHDELTAPPSRPKYWLVVYGAATLFLILSVFFFLRNTFGGEEIVEVTTVTMMSPTQANALLTASGYVVAQRKASIASKATGRIMYLGFREGDKVKQGDVIARIESADVEAALAQARADLDVAKAEKSDAEQSLGRSKKLLERQLISQAEFDGVKARFDRVVASISSRQAAVKAAEVQLENTRIRAPFDGTILSKNADVGEVVAPFAAGASSRVAVVTIADMSSLEVEADVSESNIERITVGQPCEISLDAYPDKRYRGNVDKIIPTADRAKATVLTKIRFVEQDKRVLPEMSAKVHFLSMQSSEPTDGEPRLAVDPLALTTRNGGKVAFIMHDNIVVETPVSIGNAMGRLIEITSGLSAGDKVVLKPSESLRSGSRVKLKQ